MNDKWDNVDCELDRYTTKKSRICAKYEYSLIANDKLRRSDKAEVGIWNDAKGEKVQIKHPCQEEIACDAWWYACKSSLSRMSYVVWLFEDSQPGGWVFMISHGIKVGTMCICSILKHRSCQSCTMGRLQNRRVVQSHEIQLVRVWKIEMDNWIL